MSWKTVKRITRRLDLYVESPPDYKNYLEGQLDKLDKNPHGQSVAKGKKGQI